MPELRDASIIPVILAERVCGGMFPSPDVSAVPPPTPAATATAVAVPPSSPLGCKPDGDGATTGATDGDVGVPLTPATSNIPHTLNPINNQILT